MSAAFQIPEIPPTGPAPAAADPVHVAAVRADRGGGLRPTRRAIAIAALGFALAAIPAVVWPSLWGVWPLFWTALLAGIAADVVAIPFRSRAACRVAVPQTLFIGETGDVVLTLATASPASLRTEILLDVSALLGSVPPLRTRVGRKPVETRIPIRAARRGVAVVERAWVRFTGPLGLFSRVVRFPIAREVPIVPNIRPVRAIAVKFFGDRAARSGLKVERFQGDGTDFDSLKEYVTGDDARVLDWRTTARHWKLMVRQFRAERNHQVVFAVDSGRLMSESLDGIPKLDHALNAALVMSYVCLRTGDRVGLFTFDAQVGLRIDPMGGLKSFPAFTKLAARVDYSDLETNFTLGLTTLGESLRRRTLLVVLTDFVDTVTAELMIENLGRLAKRHLVLFVALRDPELERSLGKAPSTVLDLNRAVVGAGFVRDREVVLKRLRRRGILPIDAEPAHVGTRIVNTYLDIKRRERL